MPVEEREAEAGDRCLQVQDFCLQQQLCTLNLCFFSEACLGQRKRWGIERWKYFSPVFSALCGPPKLWVSNGKLFVNKCFATHLPTLPRAWGVFQIQDLFLPSQMSRRTGKCKPHQRCGCHASSPHKSTGYCGQDLFESFLSFLKCLFHERVWKHHTNTWSCQIATIKTKQKF